MLRLYHFNGESVVTFETMIVASLACAAIVLFGALYAIFLALGHMKQNLYYYYCSYAFYALLAVSAWLLVDALQLSRIWLLLVATLLVGYLIGPQFIWRLSVAVHKVDDEKSPNSNLSIGDCHESN